MNVGELVGAEFDLAAFELFDGLGNVGGNRSGLWVRHEASGTKDTSELADDRHHVGCSDSDVEIEHATFDLLSEVLSANELSTSVLGCLRSFALSEHCNTHRLASSRRQRHGATNHLFGLARIDTQAKDHVDGLFIVPLREGGHDRRGLAYRVEVFGVIATRRVLIFLSLRHVGSLVVRSRT